METEKKTEEVKETKVSPVDTNYATFIKFVKGYIKRDGVEQFVKWLDSSDAKTAPASSRYHGAYSGGYVEHSLHVFNRLFKLAKAEYGDQCPYSKETLALVSLLHDVDNVGKYELYYRNVKVEDGTWIQTPEFKIKDDAIRKALGTHALTSIYILSQFFKLTTDEHIAILNHMGGENYEEKDVSLNIYEAYRTCPLAVLLHTADLLAKGIDEGITNKQCVLAESIYEALKPEEKEGDDNGTDTEIQTENNK